ncbi:MAG: PilZ domain-containing protein [Desulfobulbaceae bacterium]|nr:PilZ domain-containing protein [Desulfobulbaceae bacterium]
MRDRERRQSQRYKLHYPIIVSSIRGIGNPDGYHYGEILDAGRYGVRLRLENFGDVAIGTNLQLVCQPASGHEPNNKCLPIAIQGRVVWLDRQGKEFALRYTN